MKKYIIIFKEKNFKPIEFIINGKGKSCFVKGGIEIANERLMFNFQGLEDDLLSSIKVMLEKRFGDIEIKENVIS